MDGRTADMRRQRPAGRIAVGRVFIDQFNSTQLRGKIREALAFVDTRSIIGPSSRVFTKPNLTWRTPTPGVTVRPEFI